MHVHILRCGEVEIPDVEFSQVSAIPTRQELKSIDAAAAAILPEDPTPSLDEIARQPDVSHLGAPQFAPQPIDDPLRIIVVGNDAALSAVLTRMMRADYLWAEVGYVPASSGGAALASTAAQNWNIPTDVDAAMALALEGAVRPVPLIRNDTGLAVAGSATVSSWDNGPMTGEIIVDDTTIARGESTKDSPFGARLVPMMDAPGILAATAITPVANYRALGLDVTEDTAETGLLARFKRKFAKTQELGQLDPSSARTGRALQAGGPELRVIVDGVSGKRPVQRSTFYRHLRDLQIIRPA